MRSIEDQSGRSSELFIRSWSRAWSGINASSNGDGLRRELISRYDESARKYHTVQHLQECLNMFESVSDLVLRPAELEMALWFHDAIYDPIRTDNEIRSAELACSTLETGGVDSVVINRISNLILATEHVAVFSEADTRILVDIDLGILGATRERFIEYESQVRKEYAFVPESVFWNKRRDILQRFIDRSFLYTTPYFQSEFERQARDNIAWSIAELCKIHVVSKLHAEAEGHVPAGIVTGNAEIRAVNLDISSVLPVQNSESRGKAVEDFCVFVKPQALGDWKAECTSKQVL